MNVRIEIPDYPSKVVYIKLIFWKDDTGDEC